MKKHLLVLSLFMWMGTLFAQQPLPHFPTDDEQRISEAYFQQVRESRVVPTPPPFPVRTMAEWEEVQAVMITWTGFPEILTEIARAAVEECTVLIVTTDPTGTASQLEAAGVALDNIEFIQEGFNSIWIRDYGPWTVYGNDVDSLVLVDWIYNRPRPLDDEIPLAAANHLDLEIYEAVAPPDDWVHTGGNHLRDGLGTAFSSDLVLDENPGKTEAEIDAIAQEYLGVERYIKLPKLPFDGIHHLDMHMRIIDEETIIVGQYPEGVADGPQIEANIEYIKTNFQTAFGNEYEFVRIPMPPDQFGRYPDDNGFYRTFTNALFINETIIVPIYEEQYDTTALRIYEENLPGYNVVGIDCNDIIPSLGALHCITKLIGTNDPLLIAHPRIRDTYDATATHLAKAKIQHKSGIAEATLYYRINEVASYTAVEMELVDAAEDMWEASIPAQPAGTNIQYYIHATANSGKEQVRPMVAPEGYFEFQILEVTAAPVANFFALTTTACTDTPIEFRDDSEGAVESRVWSFEGGTPATSTEENPVVTFAEPGTYNIGLVTTNQIGSDSEIRTGYITILDNGVAPEFEGFDDFSPDIWTIDNPTNDDAEWTITDEPQCYGQALAMDNFSDDTRGTSDYLTTRVNLTDLSNVNLSFDVAYAPYSANFFDRLKVNVIDCSGEPITVFDKSGIVLATAPATESAFVPDCSQWRHEVVDLSDFQGPLTIEFENVGGYGNIVYLDNIGFGSPDLANAAPSVSITSPEDGTTYLNELPALEIEVDANDEDGNVQSVALLINGLLIGTTNEAPYSFNYTLPEIGSYEMLARATDNLGVISFSEPVTVIADEETSAVELFKASGVTFFPNPADENVVLKQQTPQTFELRLMNANGQLVKSTTIRQTQQSLSVAALPSGTYLLQLIDQNGQLYSTKLEVVH
ncbi:MAG: agmatine deiminase family protein [Saprospiraceae bacterium]|nr:agmatine deiminase family protein [Saprospiraceae bacterium]